MFVKTNISNIYFISNKNDYFLFSVFFSKKEIINYINKIYKIPVYEVKTQILYKKNNRRLKKVFLRLSKNKSVICQ
ncbi:hypothetical protein [Candidatus Karelsulcia muelleri]|uniref:hypothetical protein n=1 Tax=Candidatus Karelsulcia muelleri TaxID=336810 RepID=UPI00216AFB43|nr:hypothetical protein [Candidatus Karelsulcia muelleri]